MRQHFTRKAYGFAGISLMAALTASVRRSASFMLTTYALASSTLIAARRLRCVADSALNSRQSDDAAEARARAMFELHARHGSSLVAGPATSSLSRRRGGTPP